MRKVYELLLRENSSPRILYIKMRDNRTKYFETFEVVGYMYTRINEINTHMKEIKLKWLVPFIHLNTTT